MTTLFDEPAPQAARAVLRVSHNPGDGKESLRITARNDKGQETTTWLYPALLTRSAQEPALFRAVEHVLRVVGCTIDDL